MSRRRQASASIALVAITLAATSSVAAAQRPGPWVWVRDFDNVWIDRAGVDAFTATPGDRDLLVALDGDDVLDAGDRRDLVYGGGGDDSILAGPGSDRVRGGAGADTIARLDITDSTGNGPEVLSLRPAATVPSAAQPYRFYVRNKSAGGTANPGSSWMPFTVAMRNDAQRCCQAPPGALFASSTTNVSGALGSAVTGTNPRRCRW